MTRPLHPVSSSFASPSFVSYFIPEMDREAAPPAALRTRTISSSSSSLERAGHLAKKYSTRLLSVLAVVFVNVIFITAMFQCRFEPRLVLFYASSVLFYADLYLWTRFYKNTPLRRGLGYAAVGLGVFLSSIFIYSFAPAIQFPLVIGGWLLLAVPAAYCLYRVIVLHLDDDEDTHAQVQVEMRVGPPV